MPTLRRVLPAEAVQRVREEVGKAPATPRDVQDATRLPSGVVHHALRNLLEIGDIVVWGEIDTKPPCHVYSVPAMTQDHFGGCRG